MIRASDAILVQNSWAREPTPGYCLQRAFNMYGLTSEFNNAWCPRFIETVDLQRITTGSEQGASVPLEDSRVDKPELCRIHDRTNESSVPMNLCYKY